MSCTKKIHFATQTRAGLLDHKLPVNNVTVFHLGIANQKKLTKGQHGPAMVVVVALLLSSMVREPIARANYFWLVRGVRSVSNS